MSETTPGNDQAPELTDPVGQAGASLMGIAPWPALPPAETEPVTSLTAAEMRAQAEKLLAQADAMDSHLL